jgi:GTP cyclohydrolase I
MDRKKMTDGIRTFLDGLGQRFPGDDLDDTPDRVARAWAEDLVGGYATSAEDLLSWTPVPEGGGPVVVRRISYASVCAHHLLPFYGQADVAYLPDERLVGLSKIARVVDAFARRLQTQEHLTIQIVDALASVLAPRGVVAVLEAKHLCMSLRGVRKEQGRMVTMAARGIYEDDPVARGEVLEMMRERRATR